MAVSEWDARELARLEKLIARLSVFDRNKAIREAVKKAAAPFAKAYRKELPRGDKAHSPDVKQIHRVISTQTRELKNAAGWMSVTGAAAKKGSPEGWYANLLEHGWKKHQKTNAHIPGKRPLMAAAAETKRAQQTALIKELVKAIRAEGG